ncbi:MAG: EVE domain-containing protein [Ignavibacteriae bacterium]|jgi:hypothetical protein|nr:EVE domain-containing protein [Ignavibacteriota bacterium]MCE7855107.1 EVE domain-containing protein [Ignavibacteria bacterium CHB3]GJQ44128.1 MAG: hypothetical protein JETCAE03_36260 [Ignavibacteriaceae bacterium]
MKKPTYWIDLFTGTTWEEFLKAGGNITGFRENRWKTVQQFKPGDFLLCYITGISRFVGALEITSKPFKDKTKIWEYDSFPCRTEAKKVVVLTPETAIPISDLKEKLAIFKNQRTPRSWTSKFRSSPTKLNNTDGETIINELFEASKNPVKREIDKNKLSYLPNIFKAKIGSVTIPEKEEEEKTEDQTKESSSHLEIQWLLLKLGNDMGYDVWAARNDRNKEYNGIKFTSLPKIKTELPLQFDEATNRTIELIDVLWLKGNTIVSAFEIESTTLIYSGLLRMSDLISMQPNLKIPLYLVAPDERRSKVISEINRPTFLKLSPPLSRICKFIPFSVLKEKISKAEGFITVLKPEFIDTFSESCEVDRL